MTVCRNAGLPYRAGFIPPRIVTHHVVQAFQPACQEVAA